MKHAMLAIDYVTCFCENMKMRYEAIHRLAQVQLQNRQMKSRGRFTSFRINDILHSPLKIEENRDFPPKYTTQINNKNNRENARKIKRKCKTSPSRTIVRPWDCGAKYRESENFEGSSSEEEISVDDTIPAKRKKPSPLDALMKMASKSFTSQTQAHLENNHGFNLAIGKQLTAKKRRKSRTAFTNQQIFELEKRFLYQKYLTPSDRDEIAMSLNLSNAQVITWFQNRRAKLKRDLEELKNDMHATGLETELSDTLDKLSNKKFIDENISNLQLRIGDSNSDPVSLSTYKDEKDIST